MEKLKNLLSLQNLMATTTKPMTDEERLQKEIDIMNDAEGDLDDGIDCPLCKNRGYIAFNKEGYKTFKECSCMIKRRNKDLLRKSGLSEIIENCTFETYIAKEPWQQAIKEKAMNFAQNPFGHWFFAGGQVGCGKTHICTAICGELMNRGAEVLYVKWLNEIVKLKQIQYAERETYQERMNQIKNVTILYLDDFFKSGGLPTKPDMDTAQEILDYRSDNHKITIISSEYNINEIYETMNSIGSRIIGKAEGFIVSVDKNVEKDQRLK